MRISFFMMILSQQEYDQGDGQRFSRLPQPEGRGAGMLSS
jgi:hypothetical protein